MVPVIIPAYEPDERLLTLLEELKELACPVIVVDDGSGEAYREIFTAARALVEDRGGTVLCHEVNRGKGRALKTAFAWVLERYPQAIGAVTADSDGQHDVNSIRAVAGELEQWPKSLVLGVRRFEEEQVPWKNRAGNLITVAVMGYVAGIRVSDTQTGLRGIPAAFMEELTHFPEDRFEFETKMLLACPGRWPIREVPIRTIYAPKGDYRTHFNKVTDSARIYRLLGAKFLRYLVSSGSSCLLDLVLFAVCCRLLKAAHPAAYVLMSTVIARVISAAFNYTVNYRLVFQSKEHPAKSAGKYVLLALVQMMLSAVAVSRLVALLPGAVEVAVKVVVDTLLFFVSYYVQRRFVY